MKPGLKLNLGLALIDLRTTGSSWRLEFRAPLVIRNKIFKKIDKKSKQLTEKGSTVGSKNTKISQENT